MASDTPERFPGPEASSHSPERGCFRLHHRLPLQGIEGLLQQWGPAQIALCAVSQALLQGIGRQAVSLGRQGGRIVAEHLSPELHRRAEEDGTVLQQAWPSPELCTADAFRPIGMHEIGGGPTGEAAGRSMGCHPCHGAELQRQPQLAEGHLQPMAALHISLLAPLRVGPPGQGIGEIAGMQHGSTSARPADQIDHTSDVQIVPVGFEPPLMPSQRQRGTPPAVEAEHGISARQELIEHPAIERHLGGAIQLERRYPAPGRPHRAMGRKESRALWRKLSPPRPHSR